MSWSQSGEIVVFRPADTTAGGVKTELEINGQALGEVAIGAATRLTGVSPGKYVIDLRCTYSGLGGALKTLVLPVAADEVLFVEIVPQWGGFKMKKSTEAAAAGLTETSYEAEPELMDVNAEVVESGRTIITSDEPAFDENVVFNQSNTALSVESIAVIPKQGFDCGGRKLSGDDLADLAETALLSHYTIVDRWQIEKELKTIRKKNGPAMFEEALLGAGALTDAEGYVIVEYGCMDREETIKAKLVHVGSSEILWSCISTETGPAKTFRELEDRLAE